MMGGCPEMIKEDEESIVSTFSVDCTYGKAAGEPIPHRDGEAKDRAEKDGTLGSSVAACYDRSAKQVTCARCREGICQTCVCAREAD